MSCFHCAVWCSGRFIVFSKLVTCKVLLKFYFERYSFTFHFTKFRRHFLKKIKVEQKLSFHSKSGEKVIPLLYIYILSRNREKQLCNKAILKACAYTRNTATLLVTVIVNRTKTVLFLEMIFGYFVLFIKKLY